MPFTSVYAGKYGTEDKLKTDNTKTKHNPEKANNIKHSETKLAWFNCFLWHSASATVTDVLSPKFGSPVWEHAIKDISIQQEQSVHLLHECIMIRDNVFTLHDFYAEDNVQFIILYICSLG